MTYEGKVVLNYKLTKKLGEGGFGAVYLAEQVDLGRRAAIKILHHQFASQPAVVERFFREARAVCEIGHRAIVAIENFGRLDTGEPFYLMEFFAGGAINQITTERWLTSDQLVAIFDPIADALGAAHAKNIIHRDLKPDNIMVRIANDRVADVRLLDFGIAKLLDGDNSKSKTGSAMGTPSYMPPEQALDAKNVDARADVYAFGATVYAAVCGRPPFDGSSVAAILLAVQQSTAPLLPSLRPDTTPELDAAIRRCLAKQPGHRPRSIIDAWAAIRSELVRANLTQAPVRPNPLTAPTMTHTPVPMGIATPVPGEAMTAPVPSANTPVPVQAPAPRAKPLVVDHVMEQASTSPEVPGKSKRGLVLGLVALVAVFAVVAIVVAKMSGGSKESAGSGSGETSGSNVVAAADAASVAIDASTVAAPDAATAIADAAEILDANDDMFTKTNVASLKAFDGAAVKKRVGRESATRMYDCRRHEPNSGPGSTISVIVSIEVDRSGRITTTRVEGASPDFNRCMQVAIERIAMYPSVSGGSITTPILLKIPAEPKPSDPRPQPGGNCSEASFAATNAKTEDDVDAMLARLNSCQSKLDSATFKRLQQALVQRQLSL